MRLHDTCRKGLLPWIITAVIMGPVFLHALPAYAALSAQDIAALREQGKKEGWTFTVTENEATQYNMDQLCGTRVPANLDMSGHKGSIPTEAAVTLPTAFDWRTQTGLPPIRNQGGCGSCWAFSTVGGLECAIKIYEGQVVDLSEQWLVSCNVDNSGCGGGWLAYDYFQWLGDKCNGVGAVMESDCPYKAKDLACGCPYPHYYKIYDWKYIGSASGVPSIAAMKQAIMEYGPISVCVSVGDAFQAYGGGIFNAQSNAGINHAVVLVGWNDSQNVWIMRNSWGPNWGESGYMRIVYNCSSIGYGAVYIDYAGVRVTADTSFGPAPLNVNFTGNTSRTVNSWAWNFGDGGTSTDSNPAHTYGPGYYDVGVTIQTPTHPYDVLKQGFISAYADTMRGDSFTVKPGQKVVMNINARNYLPLKEIRIPFCWMGPYALTFDSASTAGLRTNGMEQQQLINFDPSNKRATFYMKSSLNGSLPDLPAGNGPILSLYFTVPSYCGPGTQYITMPSYASYVPTFTAAAGTYSPVMLQGVMSRCKPGDVDGNGVGPDVGDISFMVDFLFNSGPRPPMISQADVNGDGATDIADMTYLVDYLFAGGIPPQTCH
ncbi:MAG TPA: C1 family peptidase [Candidatus Acidoferrum sp.]|nr:C1 family peptidase [Candidatus Acidoferrum sp.]